MNPDITSSPSPAGQSRRLRAPTITIDTSALPHHSPATSSPILRSTSTGKSTPPELRQSASFESRESRPTIPHNTSLPQQISHPQNFLSVPVQRKRGASQDDDTYVGSNHDSQDFDRLNPGTEVDFERDNSPFAFAPGHMAKLLNPKSLLCPILLYPNRTNPNHNHSCRRN